MHSLIKLIQLKIIASKIKRHNGVCFGGYKNTMMWLVSPHEFLHDYDRVLIRYLLRIKTLKATGKFKSYPSSRYDLHGDKREIYELS